MRPALFLDRDGTINYDCPYCSKPSKIRFYKDIFAPLKLLSKEYYIIIITNQSGIARGYFNEHDLSEMHSKIKRYISRRGGRVDAIYYCPHMPGDCTDCRKPNTGLLKRAYRDFKIDKRRSFVIGDDDNDIKLARNAGLRSIQVRRRGKMRADFYANDFNEVPRIITASDRIKGERT